VIRLVRLEDVQPQEQRARIARREQLVERRPAVLRARKGPLALPQVDEALEAAVEAEGGGPVGRVHDRGRRVARGRKALGERREAGRQVVALGWSRCGAP
jgi:hypothetical protein